MCYNCGCELPNDPMGKEHVHKGGGSLTNESFKHMAEKWGMNLEQTQKNVLNLLKKELRKD